MHSSLQLFKLQCVTLIILLLLSILSVFAQDRKVIFPCKDDDSLSKQLCRCTNGAVSCDFTKLPSSPTNRETVLEVDGSAIDTSVKRICLCETPKGVRLSLDQNFLPVVNKIHRVDLYNIKGILDVNTAFRTHFGGELFVENVANWSRIRKHEFGRGYDFQIENTKGLACCSKIASPKLEMPSLYMRNTNVTYIEQRGIDDIHGWKNLILNNVRVNGAARSAIHFGVWEMDVSVSILNSEFKNLTSEAITLLDAANVILAKSTFHPTCDSSAFVAESNLNHSSLALIHNIFRNIMIFRMNAKNVINWFNWYDFWHMATFIDLKKSHQKGRTFSIEFNTVETVVFNPSDVIETKEGDSVVFNENILSNCTCTINVPTLMQKYINRCRIYTQGSRSKDLCAVDLVKVKQTCSNRGANLQNMCKDKKGAYITDSISDWAKVEFKTKTLSLNSPFISEQLKYLEVPLHDHKLLTARSGVEPLTIMSFYFLFIPSLLYLRFMYYYCPI